MKKRFKIYNKYYNKQMKNNNNNNYNLMKHNLIECKKKYKMH